MKSFFSKLGKRKHLATFIVLSAIAIFTFAAYSPTLKANFVWDDNDFILNWKEIRTFNIVELIQTSPPTEFIGRFYRPVRTIFYSLAYQAYEKHAFGYHLQAILIHILITLIIYFIVTKLTKKPIIAAVSALIFGLHPVHTEAVSFASAGLDLLSFLFMFLSLYLYIKSKELRKKKLLIAVSVFFAFLAIFSYELTFSLPLIIILYDWTYNHIKNPKKISSYFIYSLYFLPIGLYFFIRFVILKLSTSQSEVSTTLLMNILITSKIFIRYLVALFFPIEQRIIPILYPGEKPFTPGNLFIDIYTLISIFLFIAIVAIGYKLKKNHPAVTFSIGFFLLSLIPLSNIFPGKILYAERYLYPGSFAFSLLFAYVFYLIYKLLRAKRQKFYLKIFIILFFCLALTLGFKTWDRNQDWKDSIALWSKTVKQSPDNAFGYSNLGTAYAEIGNTQQAIYNYKMAIALYPKDYISHNNLGNLYKKTGSLDLAVKEFQVTVYLQPSNIDYLQNLIDAYLENKQAEKATSALEKAILIYPNQANFYYKLGNLYIRSGNIDRAELMLKKAIEISPKHIFAYNSLSTIYLSKKDYNKALSILEKATSLEIANESVYYNLGVTYLKLNRINEAKMSFQNALDINPNFVQAREILNYIEQKYK